MRQDIRLTNSRIRLNTDNLEKIQKQLGRKLFVKVGVLGRTAARPKDEDRTSQDLTNADLGIIHEFGTDHIPARSWLRMPLVAKLPEIFKKSGQRLLNKMTTENIRDIFDELGARCMKAIDQAFASSGFGQWAPNKIPKHPKVKKGRIKTSDYNELHANKKKEYSRPLIDTGELRKSVDREVKET